VNKISQSFKLIILIGVHFAVYSNFLFASYTALPNKYENCELPSDRSYSSLQYDDIYRCHDVINPGGYLLSYDYLFGSGTRIGNNYIEASYHRTMLNGKINNLAEIKDAVSFKKTDESATILYVTRIGKGVLGTSVSVGYTPCLELSFQLRFSKYMFTGTSSIQREKAHIIYNVKDQIGTIPFAWSSQTVRANLSTPGTISEFQYSFWVPGKGIDDFDNRLAYQDMSALYKKEINHSIETELTAHYQEFSGKLYSAGTMYGYVDYLREIDFHFSLKKSFKHSVLTLGSNAYHTWSGDDSYFDIWPFSAWDIFLANRTRLKQFEMNCLEPEIGYEFRNQTQFGKVDISYLVSSEYHHLFHHENIEVKNRKVLLYPFLFGYDTYNYKITNLDGYFLIPIKAMINYKNIALSVSVKQVIPVHWKNLVNDVSTNSISEASNRKERGGSFYKMDISISY
jgi:hypothetical protein